MTNYLRRSFSAAVIVLGLTSSVSMAQPTPIDVPDVPKDLKVPKGFEVFFTGHAIGTQNFVCLPTDSGVSWRFIAPQATLFFSSDGTLGAQLTTHFLSANPGENGRPRPTWQHSVDTSSVWGRVLASSDDAKYVEPGAIPWLLLEAAGAQLGPEGGSLLTPTAYIHRLNTSGGIAPTTGCSQSSEIGALALVPYAADYFFYQASPKR